MKIFKNYGMIESEVNAQKVKEEVMQLFKGRGEEKVKYLFGKGGKKVNIPLPNMARELGSLL